jgi:hypothetical protein
MLGELVSHDIGMVDGVVVSKQQRDDLVISIGDLANAAFTRLKAHRARAQEWLVKLPRRLRPRCFDVVKWHLQLDVPSDEAERYAWMRERGNDRIATLLAPVGGDGPVTIERIERVFSTTLPEPLRTAWGSALAGTEQPEPFLRGTMAELVATATFVSDEQLACETISAAPAGRPFPLIPFAEAGDSDYVALELATNRVVTCQHDVGELGPVWSSIDSWLASPGEDEE